MPLKSYKHVTWFNILPTLPSTLLPITHLVDYSAFSVVECFLDTLDRIILQNSIIMHFDSPMRMLFCILLLLCEKLLICSLDTLSSDMLTGFAVDLYHAIRSMQKSQNLICSPMSVSLGLGMIELGARGTTLQQLRKALQFDKMQEGKIKNLVTNQSFNSLTKMVFVNAIYFKGTWKHKFNSANTRLVKFFKEDGSVFDVPMMYQQVMSRFGYFTAGKISYQVVEVPYIGDEASIFLALPAERTDLIELEKLITPQTIHNWLSTMAEEDIEINLPRFTIQQTVDLKESFGVLNVTEIFGNECDLSGITDSPDLYISQAVHQAVIEVNEEGSEGAASTGMTATIMSFPRHQFIANRPFVFVIHSNLTGAILFMGRVMDPEAVNSYGRDKDAL
ncbi:serpin I2-like isoform X2 [Chiloscyllium plagiosum]|uniref:serpin I2-like isoform X2 n=1 Tax=Chiloscyllium plagiosum TaxID=36176 RepID=UPI001CB7EA18|nr:serpin I2-like isoform X2 [Chiloscyllium plagiosum]